MSHRYGSPVSIPYSPQSASSPTPSLTYAADTADATDTTDTADFSDTPQSRHMKRKQVKNACVNCQRACKKCDDLRPCSRCVKYGIEDSCTDSQRKERKRKGADGEEHSTATERKLKIAPRSSVRGIRPFSKELLASLQDDIRAHHHDHSHSAPHESCKPSPKVTEEFRALARVCSDLHTVLSSPRRIPPVLLQMPLAIPPAIPSPVSSPPALLYPRPPAIARPFLFHPAMTRPVSPRIHPQDFSLMQRTMLNRTPPEDDDISKPVTETRHEREEKMT